MRLLLVLALAASCGPSGPACTSTTACGPLQACVDEVCQDVDCRSNKDCALESICHPETYTCEPGCTSSEDCLVGSRCDVVLGTCVARTCSDTQLDCAIAERCDPITRTCKRDPEPHCKRCSTSTQCGPTGICGRATADEGPFCFLECSPEAIEPCPAGLQCSGSLDGGFHCVGVCEDARGNR